MEKINKSQIFIFLVILALCITIPLLSTSYRPKYLYFIVNILIIAVGAESGLASFFLKVPENKKPEQIISPELFPGNGKPITRANSSTTLESSSTEKCVSVILRKCSSVKIADTVRVEKVMHKPNPSPSLGPNPSLFFIGVVEQDDHRDNDNDDHDDDDKEEIGELSGQELYHKAETFIGNFYNQLKMQREGSWKKLNEIYLNAF